VRYTFGTFTLDLDRHQLLHDGGDVHLSLKAYDLLALLIDARPRVVAKAELHKQLWPDTFVSDATLASVVAEVREALGESARQTRFIRTVHGYGYAFAADAMSEAERPRLPALACWLDWGDQRCELREGETVLGRDQQATISVDALSVSRRHARIVLDGAVATLEDLGSRNGTFVGTHRIDEPVTLSDGDVIRLGSVSFTFRSLLAPRSTVSS
jgi:DNA-binding winged helix-turn-helix (wHTH) protein